MMDLIPVQSVLSLAQGITITHVPFRHGQAMYDSPSSGTYWTQGACPKRICKCVHEMHARMFLQIHTPDSSRYWIGTTYEARHAQGQEPENIDKVCCVHPVYIRHAVWCTSEARSLRTWTTGVCLGVGARGRREEAFEEPESAGKTFGVLP